MFKVRNTPLNKTIGAAAELFTFRLLFYFLASDLAVKVIFELGLGMWWYKTGAVKQYILFCFIALDYILTAPVLARIKVYSVFAGFVGLFFVWITLHGIVIGTANENTIFKIFNDSVPLLVLAGNVLRIQSEYYDARRIDLEAIFVLWYRLVLMESLLGLLGLLAHLPTTTVPNPGIPEITFAFIFARHVIQKRIEISVLFKSLLLLALWMSDLNRTLMLYILLGYIAVLATFLTNNFLQFILAVLVSFALLCAGFALVPEDSKTYRRLEAAFNRDSSDASTDERDHEFQAIVEQQLAKGTIVSSLGFGHGAEYRVKLTHKTDNQRSFAHYSWAWFKMRYGDVGYLYCLIVFAFFIRSLAFSFYRPDTWSLFLGFIALASSIYMFTYVNFVILLLGYCWCFRPNKLVSISTPYHRERLRPVSGRLRFQ